MKYPKNIKSFLFPYVLIFILSLLALWPFFRKGFFETHDAHWWIIRFSAFHQALASGQFPVRFVDRLNNNFGYPVLNFNYPLPFYLAEIPKILGANFIFSIKIVFVASAILSSLIMFWALSKVFSRAPSIFGAVIYLWAPYRFLDLYVRGSIGENLAFTFIPLALGSIFEIQKGKKVFFPILSIAIGALILSHNTTAAFFVPILFLTSLFVISNNVVGVVTSFLIGVLSASFFWLPAIYDLKFVLFPNIKVSIIANHMSTLKSLILPSWGYGSTPSRGDTFSSQLGIVTISVLLASAMFVFKDRFKNKLQILFLLTSIVSIFMIHKISLPIWQRFSFLETIIQYPWRLLSVTVFTSSFLSASLLNKIKNKFLLSSLLIITALGLNFKYTFPKSFDLKEDSYYSTNESTTTIADEYMPTWVQKKLEKRAEKKLEIVHGDGQIINQIIKNADYQAKLDLLQDSTILVNTIYFPGWKVTSNGKNIPIKITEDTGLISFQLPKGIHEVIIDYKQTGIHLASELLSLTALILVSIQLFIWRKQISL